MLRSITVFLAACLLCSACHTGKTSAPEKNQFVLEGSVQGIRDGWVYLWEELDGARVIADSARLQQGTFAFTGRLNLPEMRYVQLAYTDGQARVFLEPGSITRVQFDANNPELIVVSGSSAHREYEAAMEVVTPFEEELEALFEWYKNPKLALNETLNDTVAARADRIYLRKLDAIHRWVNDHQGSVVAAYMVNRFLLFDAGYDQVAAWVAQFQQAIPESRYTALLEDRAQLLQASATGQLAPDFTQLSPDGKSISLSQLRGKVVLIDFWASWCGPCRKENPNLVRLYNEYKGRGFEILGVSLDQNRQEWEAAIREDSLSWLQVSDLQGWKSSAAVLYGVISIPHSVLVDTSGMVVAHQLKGALLETEIDRLIK